LPVAEWTCQLKTAAARLAVVDGLTCYVRSIMLPA
jgi:hypothetical protein